MSDDLETTRCHRKILQANVSPATIFFSYKAEYFLLYVTGVSFFLTTRVDGLNASKIKWSKFLRCTRSFIVQFLLSRKMDRTLAIRLMKLYVL